LEESGTEGVVTVQSTTPRAEPKRSTPGRSSATLHRVTPAGCACVCERGR